VPLLGKVRAILPRRKQVNPLPEDKANREYEIASVQSMEVRFVREVSYEEMACCRGSDLERPLVERGHVLRTRREVPPLLVQVSSQHTNTE